MKNSEIFWNSLVILVEIIIGFIWFQSDFKDFCIGILLLHSLFLCAYMFDSDTPKPFLFVSFLGVFILAITSVMFTIFWICDNNKFKGFKLWISDRIDKFNNFLNLKK